MYIFSLTYQNIEFVVVVVVVVVLLFLSYEGFTGILKSVYFPLTHQTIEFVIRFILFFKL